MSCLWRLLFVCLLLLGHGLPLVFASERTHQYLGAPSGSNNGSSIPNQDNTIDDESRCICQAAETSFLQQDGPTNRRSGRHELDCLAIPGISPYHFSQMRLKLRGTEELMEEHHQALRAGEWWISLPCEWTEKSGARRQNIEDIYTLSPREIKELVQKLHDPTLWRRRHLVNRDKEEEDSDSDSDDNLLELVPHPKEPIHSRRLSSMGSKKCGIVIVDAKDVINPITVEKADSQLYEHSSNQLESCSNGAIKLVKQDETVRVTLPNNIGTYDDENVSESLFEAICKHYGYRDDCHIAKERGLDHILFSMPYGLRYDEPNSFWAFASTGDYRRFSVYSGGDYANLKSGFFVPSTIIHEIGHNYRLGHAYDPRDDGDYPYGDKTTQMGGGSATFKCFNGYNYFVLGWHGAQTNEIKIRPGMAHTYHLVGIGDVHTGGIVNIKAGRYFITFNLKTGFNWEIDDKGVDADYPNQVLIHEGLDIPFRQTLKNSYFDTKLVGNLEKIGDTFEVFLSEGDFKVRLCSIDTSGSNGATVSIGLDDVGCLLPEGEVSNPMGMGMLHSQVPVTGLSGFRNEMVEFRFDVTSTAETLKCTTYGGSGDVDLFMNWESTPQITFVEGLNACSSGHPFNDESCIIHSAPPGTWYVTVHAYTSFRGLSIMCDDGSEAFSFTASPTPAAIEESQTIEIGRARTVSAELDERLSFEFHVASILVGPVQCSISGGTGDADLYVSESPVNFENPGQNDCAPRLHGNNEVCMVAVPNDNDEVRVRVLHLGVLGYRAFRNVDILCEVTLPTSTSEPTRAPTRMPTSAPTRLPTNIPTLLPPASASSGGTLSPTLIATSITGIRTMFVEGSAGQVYHFIYEIEPGTVSVLVRLRRGGGAADLYATFDRPNVIGAGEGVNDCVSKQRRSQMCSSWKLSPVGNTLYISIYGVSDFKGVKLIVNTK